MFGDVLSIARFFFVLPSRGHLKCKNGPTTSPFVANSHATPSLIKDYLMGTQ